MAIAQTVARPHTNLRERLARDPRHIVLLQATAFWLVTRALLFVFTIMAVLFANDKVPNVGFSLPSILHHWDQWDADWYFAVAQHGYYSKEATVYFPLYPLLIHIGTQILGPQSTLLIAMVISNVSSLFAFIGIGLLATLENGQTSAALPAIRVLAAYPLAFFLAAPYTEALFLALTIWTLYNARRGNWYLAALCAFWAALTRPTGAILWLPICWEYARQQGWWAWLTAHHATLIEDLHDVVMRIIWLWRFGNNYRIPAGKRMIQGIVAISSIPVALSIYMVYCYWLFGDPLSFVHAESAWYHRAMPLWDAIGITRDYYFTITPGSYYQARFMVDLLPLLLFCVLTFVLARWRASMTYVLFMVGLIYLSTAQPTVNGSFPFPLMSVSRYLMAAIPCFLLLGRAIQRYSWLDHLLVSGGFMLQALFLAFYLNGGWIV
jgi:hypothetical protein